MTDPLHPEIDVLETYADSEGYEEQRTENFWSFEDDLESSDESFGLEEGDYKTHAVEMDRTLRSLSRQASMIPAEDGGAVFISDGEFCYVNVDAMSYRHGTAEVSVRKGELSELELADVKVNPDSDYFERVVREAETSPEVDSDHVETLGDLGGGI